MRLLKTDIRTLEKARSFGQVRVAEYFGGKDPNSGIKDAEKGKFVDRNISRGLLRGGISSTNTFLPKKDSQLCWSMKK